MRKEAEKKAAQRAKKLVAQMTLGEKVSQLLYGAPAIPRLKVPDYNWWNECLHGVGRAGVATVFPQAIAMAASFDPALLHRVATAISDEARAKYIEFDRHGDHDIYKGLTYWSPNINIFRDPRWGRGHETYGEDPYLTGEMGCAFIRGLQGDDPECRKLDATIKHYAVHSGPEGLRHEFDAKVNQKDLYETYLWAFRYCIDHARPAAVMGAYNRTNGEPCCASHTLLQDILREQFGFEGYVVSDCGAICDISEHHRVAGSTVEAAAMAVENGCDLNCGHAYKNLMAAVDAGLITEEAITRSAERLFAARFSLGMFDEKTPYSDIPYETVHCPAHKELARRMAQEGIVLLKNDGVLPIKDDVRSIAVIGPNAHSIDVLLGNYNGTPEEEVTILEGIRARFSSARVTYARGCDLLREATGEWEEKPLTEAVIAAERADVTVLCLGLSPRMEGEEGDAFNADASGDKTTLELTKPQRALLEAVAAASKALVVLHVSGSAMDLSRADELAGAVVQVFYPGEQGGAAVADVLAGDVSPSGRLPVTFYRSDEDLPPFTDYAMAGRTYRYFEGKPLYPFGYGLSYTTFSYSRLSLNADALVAGGPLVARVCVKNTGDRAGTEVVQVYVTAHGAPAPAPRHKLAAFARVDLAPGEEKEVTLSIPAEVLESVDENGHRALCTGRYTVYAGGGQPRYTNGAKAEFTL